EGDRRKDLVRNVEWYARLGILEYFVFDRGRGRLHGHRLPEVGARAYVPILPQSGRFYSTVLDLELTVESDRLRFFFGTARLLAPAAPIMDLERRAAEQPQRADEHARHAEEQAQRADEQARHAEEQAERADQQARHAEEQAQRADQQARHAEEQAQRAD